jgi:hypothetical protein
MSSDNHATAWKQEPDKTRVDNKALLYPIYDIICENGQRVVRIYIHFSMMMAKTPLAMCICISGFDDKELASCKRLFSSLLVRDSTLCVCAHHKKKISIVLLLA